MSQQEVSEGTYVELVVPGLLCQEPSRVRSVDGAPAPLPP
jgi:hypothetical protein